MRIARSLLAGSVIALTGLPASAGPHDLPNLVPSIPRNVIVDSFPATDPDLPEARQRLRFIVTFLNRGSHPLDLLVVPTSADAAQGNQREVLQCDTFAGPACVNRTSVGSTIFHSRHEIEIATYSMVPVNAEGVPDFDAPPIASATQFISCIHDNTWDYESPPDNQPLYNDPTGTSCSTHVRQGITSGYGMLVGHSFAIDDIPPDIYGVVATINPQGRFQETSLRDNRSWVVVDLTAPPCDDGTVPVLASGLS